MAEFDDSLDKRLRQLGRFVARTWRGTHRSLRTGAWVLWATGGIFTAAGVYLDVIGWWGSLPFLTNLLTTVTGGLLGVPIVVLLIQRLSKEAFEEHVAEETRQRVEQEAQLRQAIASLVRRSTAGTTHNGRDEATPILRDIEIDLRFLDTRLPAATDPDVRRLQSALWTASAPVPPRGSITPEAAAAMRTALSLWKGVVRIGAVTMIRADWLTLRRKIPPAIAARAQAEIERFSAAVAAARNPDHDWYEQASTLVDPSGRKTPRRSAARLFEQGRDTLEGLLQLRQALDALKTALTEPAPRP